jgi:hypothetical protein
VAEHGGYRQPANPAPVSGPGRLSKRTDGGPGNAKQPVRWVSGLPYGEGKEMMDLQGAAPMSAAPSTPLVSFDAPTDRPNEPVTTGNPMGAGAGPEALPAPAPQNDVVSAVIRAAYARYPSPALGSLVNQLDAEGR